MSYMNLRVRLLRRAHRKSSVGADGIIFLTRYAHDAILKQLRRAPKSSAIVPHGIAPGFFQAPKPQQPIAAYDDRRPFTVLYVSIVDVYKHQTQLARAVTRLRREGLPLTLRLVGPEYPP